MKIIITHTGQWRYSNESLESFENQVLAPLRNDGHEIHLTAKYWKIDFTARLLMEVEDYSKRARKYCKSLKIEWVEENILSAHNSFELIQHVDKLMYYRVFKMLEVICNDIVSNHPDADLVIRTRNDLVYLNKLVIPKNIHLDCLYIPPIEGHEEIPYDPRYVCNDQIAIGGLQIMTVYLNMVMQSSIKIQEFERCNIEKDGNLHGIEGILKEYLDVNKIKVKNLNLIYYIYGKKQQNFKFFINNNLPDILVNSKQTVFKRLMFRVLRKFCVSIGRI
jgi:hypothetical protein